MVKQRMNVADVACEVACLKERIIGMRVANIYDLSPKVYLISHMQRVPLGMEDVS